MKFRNILPALLFISGQVLGQGSTVFEDFTLKDSRQNKDFRLSEYNSSKAIVIIFTSNTCPYSEHYDKRIINLESEYRDKGVSFVLINSNFNKKVNSENIKEMSKKASNYSFPYLIDDEQSIARLLKAKKNPEAFIVIPVEGKFKIVYQGAIDNNPQVESDVSKTYLRNAIDQVLGGGKINPAYVNPVGCIIKIK